MAWDVGAQKKTKRKNINKELSEVKGYLEDKDAQLWLYKYFSENISVLVDLLAGIKLLPFQHMMIKAMMNSDYFLAILGRGSSKTWTSAMFLILYAMLNPGIKIGVLSKTFRQSRLLMQKILDFRSSPKAKMLSDCITDIKCRTDEWVFSIGRSQIIALPLGEGEKLRGYRFQAMVIDELLLMPEKILTEVILPFIGVATNPAERKMVREAEDALIEQGKMLEEDRTVWPNNKLIGLSSASYKFEYLYKLYQIYEQAILSGDNETAKYCVFHMGIDAVPKELYDAAQIANAKLSMSEAQFGREYGAKFSDDSSGFYKMSKMKACFYEDGSGTHVEAVGQKGAEYILSIDPSWSESDSSDDFAMHVIKIYKETGIGVVVHSYALSGSRMADHINYFAFLLENFNIVGIVADFMGGSQFIQAANESQLFKEKKLEIKIIDVDIEDPVEYSEDVKKVRAEYNLTEKRICILRKPSSNWIRFANELLQGDFDRKTIMFAGRAMDSDLTSQCSKIEPYFRNLKFLREEGAFDVSQVDFVENLSDLLEMTITQCAMIEITQSPQGHQTFDLPLNLKKQRGINKARRDSYSALVLGNWMKKIYLDMLTMPEVEVQKTFTPFFV